MADEAFEELILNSGFFHRAQGEEPVGIYFHNAAMQPGAGCYDPAADEAYIPSCEHHECLLRQYLAVLWAEGVFDPERADEQRQRIADFIDGDDSSTGDACEPVDITEDDDDPEMTIALLLQEGFTIRAFPPEED